MLYLEKTKEGDAMIRIAVVDDEKDMRELLCRRLTEELSRLNVDFAVNEYDSGESFIDDHSKGIVFDMLFLDIRLSDCTGMDVARKLREQGSGVLLVFVTSFDNYVFEAFDYEAQAYLRKSELDVRFRSAVEKLVKKYTESHKEIVLLSFYYIVPSNSVFPPTLILSTPIFLPLLKLKLSIYPTSSPKWSR